MGYRDLELDGGFPANTTLYMCDCGDVVWSKEKHDKKHEGQAETARKAHSADAWNRPIKTGRSS